MEYKISRFAGKRCKLAGMVCPASNNPAGGKWCPAWLELTEYDQSGKAVLERGECALQQIPVMLAKLEVDSLRATNLANQARNAAESAPRRLMALAENRRLTR